MKQIDYTPVDTVLKAFKFNDDAGDPMVLTNGQREILRCIVTRQSPTGQTRIHIQTPTRYGKSAVVAIGVVVGAAVKGEKWAIIAPSQDKAQIIMDYCVRYALDNPMLKETLDLKGDVLERLRRERSRNRLTFIGSGEVRIFTADVRNRQTVGNALMGFGAANIVEDESALIPDDVHAKIMRMLANSTDNFLVKIGNPFTRGHFLKSSQDPKYHKIVIDWRIGVAEGRYLQEYIEEVRGLPFFDVLWEAQFPSSGMMDTQGWYPLLTDMDIDKAMVDLDQMFGELHLGVDVAAGGANYSVVVERSYNVARKLLKDRNADTMTLATNVVAIFKSELIQPFNAAIDKVGVGQGVYDHLKRQIAISGVNAGETASNSEMFSNKRAEMFWRLREWILGGGKLLRDPDWYQLCNIKYKQDLRKRVKIITKEELLLQGIDSPDIADALSLTFAHGGMATERGDVERVPTKVYSPLDIARTQVKNIADALDPYDQRHL